MKRSDNAPAYTANWNFKVKVLDFVKSGGLTSTVDTTERSAVSPGLFFRNQAVVGMGTVYRIRASPGNHDDLFDERLDKGPALGQFAVLQEVPHVLGVGGDSLHVVQVRPALGEDRSRIRRRILKTLLPLPVLFDPV